MKLNNNERAELIDLLDRLVVAAGFRNQRELNANPTIRRQVLHTMCATQEQAALVSNILKGTE